MASAGRAYGRSPGKTGSGGPSKSNSTVRPGVAKGKSNDDTNLLGTQQMTPKNNQSSLKAVPATKARNTGPVKSATQRATPGYDPRNTGTVKNNTQKATPPYPGSGATGSQGGMLSATGNAGLGDGRNLNASKPAGSNLHRLTKKTGGNRGKRG